MRNTTLALLAACALGIGVGAAEIQMRWQESKYVDPAIAVCEYVTFRTRGYPAEYRRSNASIDRSRVTIEYTAAALGTKPKHFSFACIYKTDDNGSFVLDRRLSDQAKRCERIVGEMDAAAQQRAVAIQDRATLLEAKKCAERIAHESLNVLKEIAMDLDFALANEAIYPIRPEDTKLRTYD